MTNKLRFFFIGLLGASLVLGGCANAPEDSGRVADSADEFIRLVQNTQQSDFEPYTPSEMLAESAVVVHGTVASVEDGREYLVDGEQGTPSYHLIVGIKPNEVVKDDTGKVADLVFFELSRPENVAPSEYKRMLPVGTEVALFASPWDDPGFKVRNPEGVSWSGSPVFLPLTQGLWMASDEGFRSVLTMEEVSDGEWAEVDSWASLRDAAR